MTYFPEKLAQNPSKYLGINTLLHLLFNLTSQICCISTIDTLGRVRSEIRMYVSGFVERVLRCVENANCGRKLLKIDAYLDIDIVTPRRIIMDFYTVIGPWADK